MLAEILPPPSVINRPQKSHLLPNFNIEREVEALFEISQRDSPETALKEVRGNIIGFKLEFYLQQALLPNPVRLSSKGHIENALSSQRVLDMITKRERFGAVYDGFETVEAYLASAAPGSMAVIASPSGWSGLQNSFGEDYNYHDSQVYTFRLNEGGDLEAFTFVTDMDYDQNVRLLEALGVDTASLDKPITYRQRLAQMVKTPALIEPGKVSGFGEITSMIEGVMGTDVIRVVKNADGTKSNRYFSDVYHDLDRGKELLGLDRRCEEIVGGFDDFVREILKLQSPEVARLAIEIKLSNTLVEVYSAVSGQEVPIGISTKERELFYIRQTKQIGLLYGCSGDGGSAVGISTGLGVRLASTESGSVSYSKGDCVKCFRKNTEVGPCKLCRSCC